MRKLFFLSIVLSVSTLAGSEAAQQNAPTQPPTSQQGQPVQNELDPQTKKLMDATAKQSYPLTGSSVSADVKVEAVLLPFNVCSRVFGREIANNYAAVEITISNHNPDASLIVHTIFIDYSQWALSGHLYLKEAEQARTKAMAAGEKNSKAGLTGRQAEPPLGTETNSYEAETKATQIASAEYRTVRGQALDAQPGTARNRTIRWLRFAGSIASAYSFVTRDQDIVKGIAAFAGQGVPAAEALFPDSTVEQLNRISDLGFKVNKVIPKSSSDIIVAFFPLERFLTPGLVHIYKHKPALFFAPYAIAFDKQARSELEPIFAEFLGSRRKAACFLQTLPLVYMNDYVKAVENPGQPRPTPTPTGTPQNQGDSSRNPSEEKSSQGSTVAVNQGGTIDSSLLPQCRGDETVDLGQVQTVMKFLAHASLNTVRVVVGGDFTVNVNDIPATVNGVELDKGPGAWTTSGDQTGILRGSFLANGEPQIVEKDSGVKIVALDSSADSTMKVKITLPDSPLKPGTTITFRVDKTNSETKKTVQGVPFSFQVPRPLEGTELSLGNALANDDGTVNVKGANFSDNTVVLLFANAANASDPAKADFKLKKGDAGVKPVSSSEFVIDLCQLKSFDFDKTWTVRVQDGAQIAPLSPTFTPSTAAKNKCKPAGGAATAQPQTTQPGGGNAPATTGTKTPPPPGTKTGTPGGNRKQQKAGGQ